MSDGDTHLTKAQAEILDEVNRKLREHFDHSVVLISTEVPVGSDTYRDGYWNGGSVPSLGLLTWGQAHLFEKMKAGKD